MAKSPVFGLGRNWNHRPSSAKINPSAANVKMKGKKIKMMSCGCCVCLDFRDEIMNKIHRKEMKDAA